ncbi:hypothetical protein [Acetobacter indonesiensis]|uniref:hypothetical protein n=1 Tax=Acetobacter indonesiensis TaxID=104101 RepID=UPI001178CB4B|nr:hypothetical protein [Acetobacter indonesiensis]
MKAVAFTRDWKLARQKAMNLADDEYLSIYAQHSGVKYEVARWSHFTDDFDRVKIDFYLPVPTRVFGERLAEQLEHTSKTGIGKIVLFRDTPRYVLDPGGRWLSYQAACFGVPRSRYLEAIRATRTVQHILDKQEKQFRKESMPLKIRAEAAEEALADLEIDRGLLEGEVSHLRREVARNGAE